MRFRKLRIAWSVVWGLACVLLLVVWVRSYFRLETVAYTNRLNWYVGVRSERAILKFYRGNLPPVRPGWNYTRRELPPSTFQGFHSSWKGGIGRAQVQDWLPMLILSVLAVSPWIRQLRWRFSLRTVLIAMTLVAVVLGLVVWLSARPPASPPLDVGDFP
jgi:hypothetical protein